MGRPSEKRWRAWRGGKGGKEEGEEEGDAALHIFFINYFICFFIHPFIFSFTPLIIHSSVDRAQDYKEEIKNRQMHYDEQVRPFLFLSLPPCEILPLLPLFLPF